MWSSLERPGLAIPRGGFHLQDTYRAALREENPGPGSSHSRLGCHLPGTGTVLRSLRASPRRLWQSRKPERQDRTGWKPSGGAPLARVSQSTDEGTILRSPVSEGSVGAGVSPVPSAIRQHDAPVYESRGTNLESLRLLRVLRTVRLRALRQGEPADGDLAGAHEESQF